MNKQQIALELTKLYIEKQDTIPTKKFIIAVYFNFLNNLESKEEKKTLEKLEILPDNERYSNEVLYGKINEIIDYLKSKGE